MAQAPLSDFGNAPFNFMKMRICEALDIEYKW